MTCYMWCTLSFVMYLYIFIFKKLLYNILKVDWIMIIIILILLLQFVMKLSHICYLIMIHIIHTRRCPRNARYLQNWAQCIVYTKEYNINHITAISSTVTLVLWSCTRIIIKHMCSSMPYYHLTHLSLTYYYNTYTFYTHTVASTHADIKKHIHMCTDTMHAHMHTCCLLSCKWIVEQRRRASWRVYWSWFGILTGWWIITRGNRWWRFYIAYYLIS